MTKKDVYPLPRMMIYWSLWEKPSTFHPLMKSHAKNQPLQLIVVFMSSHVCHLACAMLRQFFKCMRVVLAGLEWDSCFVYLDDILIASCIYEDHLRQVRSI